MNVRFGLTICLLALALPEASAEERAAPAQNPVLQRFVGVWDLQSTLQPSKWHPVGGEFTGKESTVWALKNRLILIRDVSAPDGKKGLFIATHDAEREAFPFWGFDSNGLAGAQWLLKWNAATNATTGRSVDSPPGWTSSGENRFPDENTNHVSFWMRDENGSLLLEGRGRKSRLPADREAAIVTAWKKHEPAVDLPAELKVLDRMIGTWDTVSQLKPAEWTPGGGKSTATVTREWILNGRYVLDTSIHSDGQESLALIGWDPGTQEYRSWWFNSEGQRNDSRGQWNEAAQTLSFRADLDNGKSMLSSVRYPTADQEVWHFKVTDAAGKVFFDMDITSRRRS